MQQPRNQKAMRQLYARSQASHDGYEADVNNTPNFKSDMHAQPAQGRPVPDKVSSFVDNLRESECNE